MAYGKQGGDYILDVYSSSAFGMIIRLPQSKTYLPGAGQCIYCPKGASAAGPLTREHIIAHKLGGKLVFHRASCRACADIINREIEIPALKRMWLSARTHLSLPTENPVNELRVGTFRSVPGEELPQDMQERDFQWKKVPVAEHPFRIPMAILAAPAALTGADTKNGYCTSVGLDFYIDDVNQTVPVEDDRRVAQLEPFSPDVTCRMAAKIAHGAALAELGPHAFEPLLPDMIMGRSNNFAHLVGHSERRGRKSENLHEIWLELHRGYLVAYVQLFAVLGFRPFQVVVGRPLGELAKYHLSFP